MNKSDKCSVVLLTYKVALYCCLVISVRSFVAGAQEISTEARRHFAEARQAQDAGLFDKAAQEYMATIRLQPGFAGAYSNLGLIYYVRGNFKESAASLSKGLRIEPNLVGANLYLGIDYLKLNHADKAIPYLQHALRLDPANKDAQSWLGTAYWEAGQTWTALQQLRETDKNFPNDPDIMFVLGEAYGKAADQELQSVIRSASGTAYVHQIFGDVYLEQHSLAKAAGHYERALQQDPGAVNIHLELGEVYLQGDQLDKAEDEYLQELRKDPPNVAAKARLAEVTLLKDQVAASLQMLDEALVISPLQAASALRLPPSFATTDERLSESMLERLRGVIPALERTPASPARNLALAFASARAGLDDTFQSAWMQFRSAIPATQPGLTLRDRARASFERQLFHDAEMEIHTWLATHPQDLEAQYLAARCHRYLSLEVLDKLLKVFPDSYRSHQLLAQTFERGDEDDKAIAEYKKVEDLAPTLPGIHFAVGHLCVKDGDLEQATAQLKEELRLNPDHPEANAEMGMVLIEQNQENDAVGYLAKAITLQPDLWIAHQELGKAYFLQKNYEAARKELKLAITDDPEGAAHYQLGMVYKALGQSEEAKREFEVSRKIKSDRLAQVRLEMPDGTKND